VHISNSNPSSPNNHKDPRRHGLSPRFTWSWTLMRACRSPAGHYSLRTLSPDRLHPSQAIMYKSGVGQMVGPPPASLRVLALLANFTCTRSSIYLPLWAQTIALDCLATQRELRLRISRLLPKVSPNLKVQLRLPSSQKPFSCGGECDRLPSGSPSERWTLRLVPSLLLFFYAIVFALN
jgi:hypothetical protein